MVTQHINKIALSLLLLITLQGCASMSKEECQGADWASIGYQDGSRGYTESRFNKHREACADHKIGADYSAYQNGHRRGLEQVYCKPRKGYYEGLNGRGYSNVCPSHLEGRFLAAYNYGRDIHKLKQDSNRLRSNLKILNEKIADYDRQIDLLHRQIQSSNAHDRSQGIKAHIKKEMRQLEDRLEVKISRVLANLGLPKRQEHEFYNLLELASKRGRLQTRLSWQREYGSKAKHAGYGSNKLQRKIQDLNKQIHNNKVKLAKSSRGAKPMKKLNRLVEMADYAGALDAQLKILVHQHKKHEKRNLARFHFQYEHTDFRLQGQHAKGQGPHHGKSNRQLRREIQQIRHSREHELRQRDEIIHELEDLENDIRHQTATSPYR